MLRMDEQRLQGRKGGLRSVLWRRHQKMCAGPSVGQIIVAHKTATVVTKEVGGWKNVVDKPGNRVLCPCFVSALCVRSCGREICLRCWGVFRIRAAAALALAAAPLAVVECFTFLKK